MFQKFKEIWRIKSLRNGMLFVLGILIIFRIVAHIPIPGIDIEALRQFFQRSRLFGLLDLFSGGTMSRFSIVMMGVGPYINASIIMQLLVHVIPSLEISSRRGIIIVKSCITITAVI